MMKRKWNGIILLFAMVYLLTGCQEKDTVEEIETEIEPLDESDSESAQNEMGTAVSGSEDELETDYLETESSDTELLETELSDTETFDVNLAEESMPDQEHSVPDAADSFYYTALTEEIKERITGKSYPDTEEPLQISYEDLAYVHVLHYDFQLQIQEGELICNQSIAQDLVDIFYELYESRYPIEKICLIDEYDADDEASMADNNTSCFNYRTVSGRTKLSNHAYGYAIDINPLYNPYVRTRDGKELISPDNAVMYADRSADFLHKIDKNDLCYRIFIEHGFRWGGAWNSSKDYQHFEKVP